MTLILPLLPFFAEHLGASPTVVGLLVSSFAACQLVAGPILGRLSDVYGRRRMLLLSQVGTLIGFIILGFAHTLFLVFLSRIIDGVTAGNISLAQAYIADVTAPEKRAQSFAVIGIAFGLGFLIGPGISGFLSQFGFIYPVMAAAALSATSIAATYFLLPETRPMEADGSVPRRRSILDTEMFARAFRRPELGSLLVQFFAFTFAFGLFMSGFPLFAERRYVWEGRPFGPKEVGYIYAYIGMLGIVQQAFVGRLVKRFGEPALIRSGFILSVVGFAATAFIYDIPPLLVASAVASTGTTFLRPALTSLITQFAGRHEQGSIIGLTQSLMSISQIVAPLLGGILIDHGQLVAWALLVSTVMVGGLLVSLLGPRSATPATPTLVSR